MSFSIDKTLYSKQEVKVYRYMLLAVLVALSLQLHIINATGMVMILLSGLVVLLSLLAGISIFNIYGKNDSVRYFIYLIIYMALIGFVRGAYKNNGDIAIALNQDWRYVILFLVGAAFASSVRTMELFHTILKIVSVLAIIGGIIGIATFDFSAVAIETRENTWSLSYYLWWISCACVTYISYYSLFCKRNYFLCVATLILYTVLGLMFLKRVVLVNVFIIFVLYAFCQKSNKIKNVFKIIIVVALLLFLANMVKPGFFMSVFNMTFDRFKSVDSFQEFDRTIEWQTYFRTASISQIIFGNGIGHFYVMEGDAVLSRASVNALHTGWANIIYKGGILYLIFYIYMYRKIFQNYRKFKSDPLFLTCFCASVSALISLAFEGSWTYTIQPLFIGVAMFYAADCKNFS